MRHPHVLSAVSGLIFMTATTVCFAQTAAQQPKSDKLGSSRSVTKAAPGHSYATASGNPAQPKVKTAPPK